MESRTLRVCGWGGGRGWKRKGKSESGVFSGGVLVWKGPDALELENLRKAGVCGVRQGSGSVYRGGSTMERGTLKKNQKLQNYSDIS